MKKYLSLVKFSHTIFALPFALLGFSLAVKSYEVSSIPLLLLKVVACMVFARSAAMAFNRYVDRRIDSKNPRTAQREIPSGVIRPSHALLFVVFNAMAFIAVTYTLNPLCFVLSPVALLVVLGYSYTKRFTALCHLILGLGLGLAPVGAYLAVSGSFDLIPVLYGIAVITWVAGFDIIYALQDVGFDQEHDLHSIPAFLGQHNALRVSTILHVICAVLLLVAGYLASQTWPDLSLGHWIGTICFIGLLVYQHTLVKPNQLEKVNLAFFTTNGIGSLLFAALFIVDLVW